MNRNVELGNIEQEDAFKLKRYLKSLCRYLGKHHKELEVMSDMTDESFMTDADIICETYEKKLAEKDEQMAKQSEIIEQLQHQIEQLKKQRAQ